MGVGEGEGTDGGQLHEAVGGHAVSDDVGGDSETTVVVREHSR